MTNGNGTPGLTKQRGTENRYVLDIKIMLLYLYLFEMHHYRPSYYLFVQIPNVAILIIQILSVLQL